MKFRQLINFHFYIRAKHSACINSYVVITYSLTLTSPYIELKSIFLNERAINSRMFGICCDETPNFKLLILFTYLTIMLDILLLFYALVRKNSIFFPLWCAKRTFYALERKNSTFYAPQCAKSFFTH